MRPQTTTSSFAPSRRASRLAGRLKFAYECLVLYVALPLFGLLCLSWSLIATILYPLLPKTIGRRVGQFGIMAIFRWFVFVLKTSGIVHCDLSALDELRDERSLIIAPNHPCLLDVVLLTSRLPNVVCIMRADIWNNIFLGGGARLAGYIRNDSPTRMVRAAAAAVRSGDQLLIFPEGTRTQQAPINRFKGGFALIAKAAGVPVQTVFLETNSSFLSKGWPLFKKPSFPLIYRARLGERWEAGDEVKPFVAKLENYYKKTLGPSGACKWSEHQNQ